jgi:type II secretory pathway predicted ATPase ExeA
MENTTKLRELARLARDFQLSRAWSDSKMCQQVAQLGSTKTFKRILDPLDALEDLNIEGQLAKYQGAVNYIELLRQKARLPEPIYDDFDNIEAAQEAVIGTLDEETNSRLVMISGENGTGKDAICGVLRARWREITVYVEADELWRDSVRRPSVNLLLHGIANGLQIRRNKDEDTGKAFQVPRTSADCLALVIEEMNKRRLVLLLNEAHHLGPAGLNIIKTLLNKTTATVVLLGIPKLLKRLMTGAYEESAQLLGNRLHRFVQLSSPRQNEILQFLERRGVTFGAGAQDGQAVADALARDCRALGNWKFIRQIARACRTLPQPMKLDAFSRAKDAETAKYYSAPKTQD